MSRFSLRTLIVVMLLGGLLILAAAQLGPSLLYLSDILVVGVASFALFAGAVTSFVHTIWNKLTWPKSNAVVVRYWIRRSDNQPDGQPFYHPVIRFQPRDAKPMLGISNCGHYDHPWPVGKTLMVRYCPSNPRHFDINSFTTNWGLTLLCVVLLPFPAFELFRLLRH